MKQTLLCMAHLIVSVSCFHFQQGNQTDAVSEQGEEQEGNHETEQEREEEQLDEAQQEKERNKKDDEQNEWSDKGIQDEK